MYYFFQTKQHPKELSMWVIGFIAYFVLAVPCYCNMYAAREDISPRFRSKRDRSKSRWQNVRIKYTELMYIMTVDFLFSPRASFWLREIVRFVIAPISMALFFVLHKIGLVLRPFVERPSNRSRRPPKRQHW
jgi:hypothetical protein